MIFNIDFCHSQDSNSIPYLIKTNAKPLDPINEVGIRKLMFGDNNHSLEFQTVPAGSTEKTINQLCLLSGVNLITSECLKR